MPYKKEDYHLIPETILILRQHGTEESLNAYIDSLSEDEIRYLVSPQPYARYHSPFHALVASRRPPKSIGYLLDKLLVMQSKKEEAKEEKSSPKKILDDIFNLEETSDRECLLSLINVTLEDFKKILCLVSPQILAAAMLQKNKFEGIGFQYVAGFPSVIFCEILHLLPSDVIEQVTKSLDPYEASVLFGRVVINQSPIGLQAFIKKLSSQAKIDFAKWVNHDSESGFQLVVQYQNSETFRALIEALSQETCDEIALKPNKEGKRGLYYVSEYKGSELLMFCDKLSPHVRKIAVNLEIDHLMECTSYSVLRKLIDSNLDPFNLNLLHITAIDGNEKLTVDEKRILQSELHGYLFVIHYPQRAVVDYPQGLLIFVSLFFQNSHPSSWYDLLKQAVVVSDPNNKEIYDPLMVYLSQSQSDDKLIYFNLFGLSGTQFLNSDQNAFVGKLFTSFGLPPQELMPEDLEKLESPGILACGNYNVMLRNGLLHLDVAAGNDHAKAKQILSSIFISAPAQQESELEYKVKIAPVDEVASGEVKMTEAQMLDKKCKEMLVILKKRIEQFDKMDWNRLSLQFQGATVEKLNHPCIAELARIKICIERAEMGSGNQKSLLERLYNTLDLAVQQSSTKQSGLLSYLFSDPFTVWATATRAIVEACEKQYYQYFPRRPIVIRWES